MIHSLAPHLEAPGRSVSNDLIQMSNNLDALTDVRVVWDDV